MNNYGNFETKERLRRRANLLYRLRRKGINCNTKRRTIYFPYNGKVERYCQIAKLCREFNFTIQLIII